MQMAGVSVVQAVCQELEQKFYEGWFHWETLKQHDAASVLKLFIRELPHPLLTVEYLSAFMSVLSECYGTGLRDRVTGPVSGGLVCLDLQLLDLSGLLSSEDEDFD